MYKQAIIYGIETRISEKIKKIIKTVMVGIPIIHNEIILLLVIIYYLYYIIFVY